MADRRTGGRTADSGQRTAESGQRTDRPVIVTHLHPESSQKWENVDVRSRGSCLTSVSVQHRAPSLPLDHGPTLFLFAAAARPPVQLHHCLAARILCCSSRLLYKVQLSDSVYSLRCHRRQVVDSLGPAINKREGVVLNQRSPRSCSRRR